MGIETGSVNIKILVVYHKKDKLFKNKYLFPVNAGREIAFKKSKDGILPDSEYRWLIDNMPGDNTGENISDKNRYYNEMTAIYWAWKNYDKLGNPDFIGLNHYRRFFKINYSSLEKYLKKYDLIYLGKPAFPEGLIQQWRDGFELWNFDEDGLEKLQALYKTMYPADFENFCNYLSSPNKGGFMNMFVMKKEDFFNYCSFIFPLLEKLENLVTTNTRTLGMLAERLTSYYLYKLENEYKRKALKTSLTDIPPTFSLSYFFSVFFNIKYLTPTIGAKHTQITFLGLKLKFRKPGSGEEGRMLNILFCASDNNLASGAFLSLVSLCKILKKDYNINPVVILPISGDGEKLLKEENIKYYYVPQISYVIKAKVSALDYIKFTIRYSKRLFALFKLINIIQKEKIDIIHLNSIYTHTGAMAGRITQTPVIWHIREVINKEYGMTLLFNKLYFKLMNSVNKIIVISNAVYKKYPEIDSNKVKIIYDGIDKSSYEIQGHRLFEDTKTHLVCTGAILKTKGQMELLQACKMLIDNGYTSWDLKIIGKGDTAALEEFITSNNLDKYVEIIGFSRNIKGWLAKSDISFIPSYYEAFGRTCVEGLFAGCLVIASNSGALPEIITDNKTGFLFKPQNAQDLYEKIVFAINNKEYCRNIARQGHEYALKNFTSEQNAAAVYEVFKEVL